MLRHPIKTLLTAILATLLMAGCTMPMPSPRMSSMQFSEYGNYLADTYGIHFDATVSQEAYHAAVAAIFANAESVALPAGVDQEGFSALEAVLTTVYIAGLDDLGDAYPPDHVEQTLAAWPGVPADLPLERGQELAAAIDSGLLNPGWRNIDLSQPPPAGFTADLLGNALQITGAFELFLGQAAEPDLQPRGASYGLARLKEPMGCSASYF